MKSRFKWLVLALLVLFPQAAHAIFNRANTFNGSVETLAVLSDGSIVVGGAFSTLNGLTRESLVLLDPEGFEDVSFYSNLGTGFTGGSNKGYVTSVAVQTNDKIVVVGGFKDLNGNARGNVVRLEPTGMEEVAFFDAFGAGLDGAFGGPANVVLLQTNGKILVGGHFAAYSSPSAGLARFEIIRLNSSGIEDASFYTNMGNGFQANANNSAVFDVAVQSDGKVVLGGSFVTFNGATRNRLLRLNASGTEDTAFNNALHTDPDAADKGFNQQVRAIAVQSDGKVLVGGLFNVVNGTTAGSFIRLNADGTLDATFNSNVGTAASDSVYEIAVQSDGKILVGGAFSSWNGATRRKLVRLLDTGALDTAFSTNLGSGFSSSGDVRAIRVQPDGKLLIGGNFTTFNGGSRSYLLRLNADGTEDGNAIACGTCTALDACHDPGTCDLATGMCSNPAKPNGTVCNDGNACTSGETCQGGACGLPTATVSCSALDQCHDPGVCAPATGMCSNPPKDNGTPCNDASACTSGETCQGGACGAPTATVTCTALDACHELGACVPETGLCTNPAVPDETPCSDDRACTTGDACRAGVCSPTANDCACASDDDCAPLDQCHLAGSCDFVTQRCSNPFAPDGSACDDADLCTSGEQCVLGTCGNATSTGACAEEAPGDVSAAADTARVSGGCIAATGSANGWSALIIVLAMYRRRRNGRSMEPVDSPWAPVFASRMKYVLTMHLHRLVGLGFRTLVAVALIGAVACGKKDRDNTEDATGADGAGDSDTDSDGDGDAPSAAWLERRVSGMLPGAGPPEVSAFRIAPDGRLVVFADGADRGGYYVVEPAARSWRRLGPERPQTSIRDVLARLTPDGSRLVFVDRYWGESIHVIGLDGSGFTTLVDQAAQSGRYLDHVLVTADSANLVYMVYAADESALFIMPLAGGTPRRLSGPAQLVVSPSNYSSPGSANGNPVLTETHVVYLAPEDGVQHLYAVALAGGAPVRLSQALASGGSVGEVNSGSSFAFAVARGGSRVVYAARDALADDYELFAVDIDGQNRVSLSGPVAAGEGISVGYDEFGARITPDGEDVLYRLANGELYVVSAGGGSAVLLSGALVVAPLEVAVSPDSATAVMATNEPALYAVALDGTGTTPLYAGTGISGYEARPRFAADGEHVVFVDDDVFSVLRNGTSLVRLSEGLDPAGTATWLEVADDGTVAFIYEGTDTSDVVTAKLDGSGIQTHGGAFVDPDELALTPAGEVYFLSEVPTPATNGGRYTLISVEPSSSAATDLTLGAPQSTYDDVTLLLATNTHLVYAAGSLSYGTDLRAVSWDGTGDHSLLGTLPLTTMRLPSHFGPAVLLGDARVLFTHRSEDGDVSVYVSDIASGPPSKVTPDGVYRCSPVMRLTPNQQVLVFSSCSDGIVALTVTTGAVVSVSGSDVGVPFNNQGSFELFPDGSGLVFVGTVAGVRELYAVDIDGQNRRKLSGTMVSGGGIYDMLSRNGFAVSPTGDRVVYVADQDTNDRAELYAAQLDGSARIKISAALISPTPGDGVATYGPQPVVTPDGADVAYLLRDGGQWSVRIVGLDGANPRYVLPGAASSNTPRFSPDGTRLLIKNVDHNGLYSVARDGSGSVEVSVADTIAIDDEVIEAGSLRFRGVTSASAYPRYYAATPAGTGLTALFPELAGSQRALAVRDGSLYAIGEAPSGTGQALYIREAGASAAIAVTPPLADGRRVEAFLVSPDRTNVGVVADPLTRGVFELFTFIP